MGLAETAQRNRFIPMHTATHLDPSGSFSGRLAQRVVDVWKAVFGEAQARTAYPLMQDEAFTSALAGLVAKLVNVDGRPDLAEYAAFRSLFARDAATTARLQARFAAALRENVSALHYARQIRAIHAGNSALFRELLDRLLTIAAADAPLNAAEYELLRAVGQVFGVSAEAWKAVVAGHIRPAGVDAYGLLGVSRRMNEAQIRQRYMAQVRMLHPDRYQAAGASADTVAMLSEKLAVLNAAYDTIRRERAAVARAS